MLQVPAFFAPPAHASRTRSAPFRPCWQMDEHGLRYALPGEPAPLLRLQPPAPGADMPVLHVQSSAPLAWPQLAAALDSWWATRPDLPHLQLAPETHARLSLPSDCRDHDGTLLRSRFYQQASLWYQGDNGGSHPLHWTCTGDTRHPLRKPLPPGILYRRYLPSLDRHLSFRRLDLSLDLDRFTAWMNQPRVAQFWELAKPRAELAAYLEKALADAHLQPVIGCFDETPFGYFELYWAAEDRLGPHYEPHAYDRGVHLLVGEPAFLGRRYTLAWLNGLSHFLFLDDPRTARLVGEPRADNAVMLSYLERTAWRKIKEFNFPHKRAALVMCERERFFTETVFA